MAPITLALRSSDMHTEQNPQPPQWAVWVARAISIVIVVPLTLIWEWLKAVGRFLVVRPVAAVARFLWRWLIVPTGKGFRAVGRFLLRWLIVPTGKGFRAVGRFLTRFALRPAWDVVVWLFTGLTRFVLRPTRRGLGRLFAAIYRGIRVVALLLGRLLYVALLVPLIWGWHTLVVAPLRWLWRTALVPGARWIGKVLWVLARLFGAAFMWAYVRVAQPLWRFLAAMGRYVYRVLLTPLGHGVRRVLQLVVVAPARWVRDSVITPMRLAGRRLRLQVGRAFGRSSS